MWVMLLRELLFSVKLSMLQYCGDWWLVVSASRYSTISTLGSTLEEPAR